MINGSHISLIKKSIAALLSALLMAAAPLPGAYQAAAQTIAGSVRTVPVSVSPALGLGSGTQAAGLSWSRSGSAAGLSRPSSLSSVLPRPSRAHVAGGSAVQPHGPAASASTPHASPAAEAPAGRRSVPSRAVSAMPSAPKPAASEKRSLATQRLRVAHLGRRLDGIALTHDAAQQRAALNRLFDLSRESSRGPTATHRPAGASAAGSAPRIRRLAPARRSDLAYAQAGPAEAARSHPAAAARAAG
ncbi:MAG: hypothetical protein ABII00_10225, partial [Elusimicrobiota bacterium]